MSFPPFLRRSWRTGCSSAAAAPSSSRNTMALGEKVLSAVVLLVGGRGRRHFDETVFCLSCWLPKSACQYSFHREGSQFQSRSTVDSPAPTFSDKVQPDRGARHRSRLTEFAQWQRRRQGRVRIQAGRGFTSLRERQTPPTGLLCYATAPREIL